MFGRKKQDDVQEMMRVWDEKLTKAFEDFELPEERYRVLWRSGRWYAEVAIPDSVQRFVDETTEPVICLTWVDIGPSTIAPYSYTYRTEALGFETAAEAHDWVRKTAAKQVTYYDKSASIIRTEQEP